MTILTRPGLDVPDGGSGDGPQGLAALLGETLVDLESVRLVLDVPGAAAARALRDRLAVQIRAHLVPRSQDADLPAVVVLGGSTGAGKSTLLNSLLGDEVSEADVLRPTTRRPVLAVHPDDAAAMAAHPIASVVDLAVHDAVPSGIALVDTPDLDSVDAENRRLAAHLVEVADLWVFVTTATRYGDALPWATLTAARDRGVTIAVVLNRVTARALGEVRGDLLDRLADDGLGDSPLFVVPDVGPHEGRLPAGKVAELSRWLTLLATSAASQRVASRTVRGGWPSLRHDLEALAACVDAQAAAARALVELTSTTLERHEAAGASAVEAGAAVTGELRTAWVAATRPGGPLRPALDATGRVPSRRAAAQARAEAVVVVESAAVAAAEGALDDAARAAERAIRGAWVAGGSGAARLLAELDRDAAAQARATRAAASAQEWVVGVTGALTGVPHASGDRASRLLDARGWASLACAAALGLREAAPALDATLGPLGPTVTTAARTDLSRRAVAAVHGELAPFLDALTTVDDGATAAALRRRAGAIHDAT